jgi:hypothetical protein
VTQPGCCEKKCCSSLQANYEHSFAAIGDPEALLYVSLAQMFKTLEDQLLYLQSLQLSCKMFLTSSSCCSLLIKDFSVVFAMSLRSFYEMLDSYIYSDLASPSTFKNHQLINSIVKLNFVKRVMGYSQQLFHLLAISAQLRVRLLTTGLLSSIGLVSAFLVLHP